MIENITVSTAFLSEILGTSPEALTEALKSEGGEAKAADEIQSYLKDAFKSKLSTVEQKARKEGHSRGKKESLTSLEKELATEWGIEEADGKTVKELVDSWLSKQKPGASTKLTPEAIKAHEVYVNDMKAEIAKRQQIETDFNQFKGQIEEEKTMNTVGSHVEGILKKNKYVLPENENIRKTVFGSFLNDLKTGGVIKLEGDKPIVRDKEGNPIRNDLMNEVSFDEYALAKAGSWFEIQKDQKSSPGSRAPVNPGTGATKNGTSFNIPEVKSADEFMVKLRELETMEEKTAMREHYAKELKQGFPG